MNFINNFIINRLEKLLDRDIEEWSNPNPPGDMVDKFIHNRLRKIIKNDSCKDSQQTYDPSNPSSPDYDKYLKAKAKVKAATQKLIDTGMTDAILLHKETGIPMEMLVEMGIKVPVHEYIIPVTYEVLGFISIKGVSPKDAVTALKNKHDTIDTPTDLKVIDDPSVIEKLTKLNKKDLIEDIIDTHLISDTAVANLTKDINQYYNV